VRGVVLANWRGGKCRYSTKCHRLLRFVCVLMPAGVGLISYRIIEANGSVLVSNGIDLIKY